MKRGLLAAAVAAAVVMVAQPSRADEVIFKNGDKLTGKIKNVDGGKMSISTAMAGDITLDMANVQTFKTDAPVEMHLADGTVLKQQVNASPEAGKIATAGGAVAAQTVPVASVQKINPPPVKWTGAVVAGATLTRGNTNTDNVNVAIDAVRRAEIDRITLGAGYLYGRQEDPDTGEKDTSADNWFVAGKYDYFLNKRLYLFAAERLERDRIADLDLRSTTSGGLGYQWWESAKTNFNTEAGVAWVYEDYRNGGSDDHFALRLAYHYDRKLNDKVLLFHNLEYLPSFEDFSDYNLNTDIGLRADLTEKLFAEFKFELRYDSTPAPDNEKEDLRYLLGVGWKF